MIFFDRKNFSDTIFDALINCFWGEIDWCSKMQFTPFNSVVQMLHLGKQLVK